MECVCVVECVCVDKVGCGVDEVSCGVDKVGCDGDGAVLCSCPFIEVCATRLSLLKDENK